MAAVGSSSGTSSRGNPLPLTMPIKQYLIFRGMRTLRPTDHASIAALNSATAPTDAKAPTPPTNITRMHAVIDAFEHRLYRLWNHIAVSPTMAIKPLDPVEGKLRRMFVAKMRTVHRLDPLESPWPTAEAVAFAKAANKPVDHGPDAVCYATAANDIAKLSFVALHMYPLGNKQHKMVLSTSLVHVAQLLIWMNTIGDRCEVYVAKTLEAVKSAAYQCPVCPAAAAKTCGCSHELRFINSLKCMGMLDMLAEQFVWCEATLCAMFGVPTTGDGTPAEWKEGTESYPEPIPDPKIPNFIHWGDPTHTVEQLDPIIDRFNVPPPPKKPLTWPPLAAYVSRPVVTSARESDLKRAALFVRSKGAKLNDERIKTPAEWAKHPLAALLFRVLLPLEYSQTATGDPADEKLVMFQRKFPDAVKILDELLKKAAAVPAVVPASE